MNSLNLKKIVIADDHPLFRNALVQSINSSTSDVQFLEAASITQLETVLKQNHDCDLLLMDLHMPGANGFVGLSHIVEYFPQLPVIMISADEKRDIAAKARQLGALGFISKSSPLATIMEGINQVLDGELYFPTLSDRTTPLIDDEQARLIKRVAELTPKQLEVFNLLSSGLLNKQIAYEQNVTEATVKAHVTAIMRKLGVNNRTQVILISNKVALDESFGENEASN